MRTSLRIRAVREGKDLLEKDPVLRRIVEVIVREIDPDRIILFGSRARGDHKEDSDYDILVLKEGIRPEDRRKLWGRISSALLKARLYSLAEIDVIVQSPRRFEELRERWDLVYYDIHREGITLYEKRVGKRVA